MAVCGCLHRSSALVSRHKPGAEDMSPKSTLRIEKSPTLLFNGPIQMAYGFIMYCSIGKIHALPINHHNMVLFKSVTSFQGLGNTLKALPL